MVSPHYLNAFLTLGLEPIFDREVILKAWRKKASQCHPDRAKSDPEKDSFHKKFIKLGLARDTCLEYLDQSREEDPGYSYETESVYEEYSEDRTRSENLEDEWREFVVNKNILASFQEALLGSIFPLFKIFVFSIVYASGTILLGLIVITGLLDIFTSHFTIPLIGWISGITFLLILSLAMNSYKMTLGNYLKHRLSGSGYPFRFFLLVWFIQNSIYPILYYSLGRWTLYLFLFGNIGVYILFNHIKEDLLNIEEGLDQLRNGGKNRNLKK
ncbi:MAG: hypothetical protein H7A24_18120 [Leptospiraceae bacterium]|nr:hypothetical protein [Leptospiraceae bacterium]MCP5513813.1 hypothetical protein [Leptospiraceae bacterium]